VRPEILAELPAGEAGREYTGTNEGPAGFVEDVRVFTRLEIIRAHSTDLFADFAEWLKTDPQSAAGHARDASGAVPGFARASNRPRRCTTSMPTTLT